MSALAHKRDGAEPLLLKRTREKPERVRGDSRAYAGNYGAAQDSLQGDWAQHANYSGLLDYVNLMEGTVNGDGAGQSELEAFETIALAGNAGAALAWDVLLVQDYWRLLPEVEIPTEWRTFRPVPRPRNRLIAQPELQAQPNPATDELWLTYGPELQADEVVIHGAQGQVLWHEVLSDGSGIVEIDLKGWSSGLYLATLLREGITVNVTKFTVAGSE